MVLTTERLLLREFKAEDFAALRVIDADPEVLRYRSRDIITEAMTRDFLIEAAQASRQQPRMRYPFALIRRSDDQLIGQCGLMIDEAVAHEGWVWYSMIRDEWGRGYMTEAARAVVQFGFESLKLHRIVATCHPDNVASSRVMEKIGMRREGHFRQNRWSKGSWCDTLLYAILDSDWDAAAPPDSERAK